MSRLLPRNHRQEALSRAYLQAIAAQCGFVCRERAADYGIDFTVQAVEVREHRYVESSFPIDIQLKSTTAATVTPTAILYDLEVKNYNDLCDANTGVPRILVLYVMPSSDSDWVRHSEQELSLRYCAYWLSLAGWPPTHNTATIRVTIPRSNLLNIETLNQLIEKARKREPL